MSRPTMSRPAASLVREATIRWTPATRRPSPPVAGPPSTLEYLLGALPIDDPREHLAALAVNACHRIIGHQIISIGTQTAALVHPAEVFRFGILSTAVRLILAHTHPGGDPTPSVDDIQLTRRMVEVGALIGIDVIDHIIIGSKIDGEGAPPQWISLREKSPQLFVPTWMHKEPRP